MTRITSSVVSSAKILIYSDNFIVHEFANNLTKNKRILYGHAREMSYENMAVVIIYPFVTIIRLINDANRRFGNIPVY